MLRLNGFVPNVDDPSAGMGGLVALHAALAAQDKWSGVILNSPLINVEWNTVMRLQASVAGVLAWAVPRSKLVPAVRPEDMSQDPAVVRLSLLASSACNAATILFLKHAINAYKACSLV
eukprot:scaffold66564_cov53-Prasinocladus_malaysianus.AAC.1